MPAGHYYQIVLREIETTRPLDRSRVARLAIEMAESTWAVVVVCRCMARGLPRRIASKRRITATWESGRLPADVVRDRMRSHDLEKRV